MSGSKNDVLTFRENDYRDWMNPTRRNLNQSVLQSSQDPLHDIPVQISVLSNSVAGIQANQTVLLNTLNSILSEVRDLRSTTTTAASTPSTPLLQSTQTCNTTPTPIPSIIIKPTPVKTIDDLWKLWIHGDLGVSPLKDWTSSQKNRVPGKSTYSKRAKICRSIEAEEGTPENQLAAFKRKYEDLFTQNSMNQNALLERLKRQKS